MTKHQIKILDDFISGQLTQKELFAQFGNELYYPDFVKQEIYKAIEQRDTENLERAIYLIGLAEDKMQYINELNTLLLVPHHRSHQVITKTIQDLKRPESIPFIKKALESNFDYLEYTCSESDAIAKWFSWALFAIGTQEAIEVLKVFSTSENEGIRKEMIYRLRKINT